MGRARIELWDNTKSVISLSHHVCSSLNMSRIKWILRSFSFSAANKIKNAVGARESLHSSSLTSTQTCFVAGCRSCVKQKLVHSTPKNNRQSWIPEASFEMRCKNACSPFFFFKNNPFPHIRGASSPFFRRLIATMMMMMMMMMKRPLFLHPSRPIACFRVWYRFTLAMCCVFPLFADLHLHSIYVSAAIRPNCTIASERVYVCVVCE